MATAPGKTEEKKLLAHVDKNLDEWESNGRETSWRSKEACDQRILELDTEPREIVYKPNYPWTSNEYRVFAALRDSNTPLAEFPLYLPDRTYQACFKKFEFQKTSGIRDDPNHGYNTARWTAREEQKLVEQRKANKSWKEISKALNGPYSRAECRTQWFNHFWEEFNNSAINGNFDIDRYKEIIKAGGGFETHDDEVNMEGCTDHEEDSSHEGASGTAALAPEQPPNMPK